jgi:multidrug resistance efflux pump
VPESSEATPAELTQNNASSSVAMVAQVVDLTAQLWLDAQCTMIASTLRGAVVKRTNDVDAAHCIAHWPSQCNGMSPAMLNAALQALDNATLVITSGHSNDDRGNGDREDVNDEAATCVVASPLDSADVHDMVAVFEFPAAIRQQQQAIVQLLQWGAIWFGLLQRERPSNAPKDRLTNVVELLASALKHSEFDAAATTAVTELASRLGCARVSLGIVHGRSIRVSAISNSSRIDTRSNLVRDIGAAMDEVVDQDASVAYPALTSGVPLVAFAQEILARRADGCSVFSTPLYDGSQTIGALTLERDGEDGFSDKDRTFCETFAALLGPVVELKHEKERPIVFKVFASLRDFVSRLFGKKHIALKLNVLLIAAIIGFFSVATGDYRITSQARLEGSVKRVVTAPRDGFVASAQFRAGDIVKAGQVLATLDDRELKLEKLKLGSQREQLDKEHRAAVTSHDRSAAVIVNARRKQIDAQLALVDEQLARARLSSPFAGIVVSGDLSQSLGSPVEHGQVLFEVAPLDGYRVILEVDERDIGDIATTQSGVLTLTGLPDASLPFTVTRIVPISTTREGRNFFEVQAELGESDVSVRPGMAGIAKVHVEQRKLIWVS